MKYTAPNVKSVSFTCPSCQTHSFFSNSSKVSVTNTDNKGFLIQRLTIRICSSCDVINIFVKEDDAYRLVYPEPLIVTPPMEEMPENVKSIYLEAAKLFSKSPRATAALLRVALEMLCIELGASKEDNLNDKIRSVAKDNPILNGDITELMHLTRITGNHSVHPGEIDLDEEIETVQSLFDFINTITHATYFIRKMIFKTKNIINK